MITIALLLHRSNIRIREVLKYLIDKTYLDYITPAGTYLLTAGVFIGVAAMNRYKTSKHYKERAEECRTLADWLTREDLRQRMLRTAEDYERMAEAVEWIILVRGEDQ